MRTIAYPDGSLGLARNDKHPLTASSKTLAEVVRREAATCAGRVGV